MNSLKKKLSHKIFFSKRSNKAKEIEKKLEEIRKYKEKLQNEQINQQACKEKFQKDKGNLEHKLKIQNDKLIVKEKLISNNLLQQNEENIASLNNEIKERMNLLISSNKNMKGKLLSLIMI